VKKVQVLENLLEYNSKNTETLSTHLDLMLKEFLKNKLLPPFAEFYSEKLKLKEFEYSSLYDSTIAINILSGNYKDLKTRNKITNFNLQNLLNVIDNRDKLVAKYKFKSYFHKDNSLLYSNKQNTELQTAILEASKGIYPEGLFSSKKIDKAFLKKQDGFVLLNAIYLISSSTITDVTSLQTGLASLVKLGLINDFKSISNELLIKEYFKKNLG